MNATPMGDAGAGSTARPALAATVLAVLAAAAGAWALSPVVTLGPGAGEWREVTAGIRWNPGAETLTGLRRSLIHFHDLTGEPAVVVLVVESRGPDDPVRLTVQRDGDTLFDLDAPSVPTLLTVPVRPGARAIDVVLAADPSRPGARGAVRIHRIALQRQPGLLRRVGQILPAIVGCAVLALAWRRASLPWAIAWSVLATAATLAALVVVADPNAALRLLPAWRTVLRRAGLLLLWGLALSRPRRLSGLAALLGTVGTLYLTTVHFGFVNEDFNFARPWTVADLLATLHGSWMPHGGVATYFRPVVSWSLALDYRVWDAWPEGYHLTNLLVHTADAAAAGAVLAALGLSRRAALAAALAWAAHPLAATAVAWTNQRTDGLCVLFFLAAIRLVLRPAGGRARIPAVLLCGALALGSKEMAMTLPAAAALGVLAAEGRRGLEERRDLLLALLALAALYVAVWASLFPEKLLRLHAGWEGEEAVATPGRWALVPAALLALVFVPFLDYEQWRILSVADLPPAYLVAGALLAPAVCLLLRRARVRAARIAVLGLAWPFLTVVPLLGIRELDLFRLGLLVSFGFALVWGAVVTALDFRSPVLAGAAAMAMVVLLGGPSRRTAAAWGPEGSMQGELPLWQRHVGETWWSSLTPEMRQRFEAQVDARGHEQRLLER